MAKLSLKNIIGPGTELNQHLQAILDRLNEPYFLEDDKGNVLIGKKTSDAHNSYLIETDAYMLGRWYASGDAGYIAGLINLFVKKEAEKKKLGAEVLNMYQEVNLMFSFAGKLAQAIDPESIAKITLGEACHVISSDSGIIVLWDEKTRQLQVLANTGHNFSSEEKINEHIFLLREILLTGQSEIMSDLHELKESGIITSDINSIMFSALKVNRRIMGAIILADTRPENYTAGALKLLTTLALQASTTIESALLYEKNIQEVRDKEEAMRKIYEVTGKFVPFEFLRSLGRNVITDIRLGDQVEKIVTVLFSDIRGYTTLSEQMTPAENFRFVCDFNLMLGPIIKKHNGFINQYLGDAIMAIFPGSPVDALAAAVEMEKTIHSYNLSRESEHKHPIRIGIGMHTGPLIMGITGDEERMDAATISDTVNTASRIESLTKYYKTSIILSEATLKLIGPDPSFHVRPLGLVQLKGKQSTLTIHECFSGNGEPEVTLKQKSLPHFRDGLRSYLNKSFSEAIESFKKVTQLNPSDQTTHLFLSNAANFVINGVPDDWTGVEQMKMK